MRFVVVFFLFSNYSEKITYTLSKGVCFTEEFLLHDQTSQSEHFVTGFVVLFCFFLCQSLGIVGVNSRI